MILYSGKDSKIYVRNFFKIEKSKEKISWQNRNIATSSKQTNIREMDFENIIDFARRLYYYEKNV
jgi:hypothetical protein